MNMTKVFSLNLTITNVSHSLRSDQEKAALLVLIGDDIEHAVPLVPNHVLRPAGEVDHEWAGNVVGHRPVSRQVEAVGTGHRAKKRVDHL